MDNRYRNLINKLESKLPERDFSEYNNGYYDGLQTAIDIIIREGER